MTVKSVAYAGKADVYNMEVEETHDYVANNGLVVHNCYDETRYFLMSRPIGQKAKPPRETKLHDPYERARL